jgi:hypothetical protein
MRKVMTILLLMGLVASVSWAEEPSAPKPQKEHEWLAKLTGEWTTHEVGQPEDKGQGSEVGRKIGPFWVLLEKKGPLPDGTTYTGILSVGFDVEKKKFVGSWFDSTSSLLWRYEGSLDAAAKSLTLEAVGPGFDGKPTNFRDVYTIEDDDKRRVTSFAEKDGKWVEYSAIQYKRKR